MSNGEHDARPAVAAVFRRLAASKQPSVIGCVDFAIALESLERAGVLVDAAHDHVAVPDVALLAAIAGALENARADL